jgi:predicted RNA-binding Zn-ribbon protein involved in translation (DUF1610 family)
MKPISIQLSDQVVSREIAPELNEALDKAGIEVVGRNYYYERSLFISLRGEYYDSNGKTLRGWYIFSDYLGELKRLIQTYTLHELLAVLPSKIETKTDVYVLYLTKDRIAFMNDVGCFYKGNSASPAVFFIHERTNIETASGASRTGTWERRSEEVKSNINIIELNKHRIKHRCPVCGKKFITARNEHYVSYHCLNCHNSYYSHESWDWLVPAPYNRKQTQGDQDDE